MGPPVALVENVHSFASVFETALFAVVSCFKVYISRITVALFTFSSIILCSVLHSDISSAWEHIGVTYICKRFPPQYHRERL